MITFPIAACLSCSATPVVASIEPGSAFVRSKQAKEDAIDPTAQKTEEEIVVTAPRLPGSVVTTYKPVLLLDRRAIRALGTASLEKLLERVRPLTRGTSGSTPVLLLNGRRIASQEEVDRLPPEAIEQMEILPEPVAAQFGYPPSARVVNIITASRFTSIEATTSLAQPAGAGGTEIEGAGSGTLLRRDLRSLLSVRVGSKADILAGHSPSSFFATPDSVERGFGETLRPAEQTLRVDGSLAGPIGRSLNASLAINWEQTVQISYASMSDSPGFHLPRLNGRLNSRTGAFGTTGMVEGFLGRWSWNSTLSARKTEFQQKLLGPAQWSSQTLGGSGLERSIAIAATGPVIRLPGGWALATARMEAGNETTRSRDFPEQRAKKLARGTASLHLALSLPLTSPDKLALTLDASVDASKMSGENHLVGGTAGFSATPLTGLQLSANYVRRSTPPTLAQAAAPVSLVPGTPFFDRLKGRNVLVNAISGGNPELSPEQLRSLDLGFELQPFVQQQFRVGATYSVSSSKRTIASVRVSDSTVELAFPALFRRDSAGTLLSVSSMPVNLKSRSERSLKWSISYSGDLRAIGTSSDRSALVEQVPLFALVNLDGTLRLHDRVRLAPGLEPLDLLDGAALDSLGGRPRVELTALVSLNSLNFGADIGARWHASSRLSSDNPASDLTFASVLTARLSLFYNLEALGSKSWMRALRLEFAIDNLFDVRQRVRDRNGNTPDSLKPVRMDPRGRAVTISLRKLF